MQMQLSPETTLQPLYRADGSASYSYHGFRVLAAVNGPVEIQRRDELAEEAAIDVVVRPASGLGSKTPPSPRLNLIVLMQPPRCS